MGLASVLDLIVPSRRRFRVREARDRVRHEQARRDISHIQRTTAEAMLAAARQAQYGDVIDGTAEEWRP